MPVRTPCNWSGEHMLRALVEPTDYSTSPEAIRNRHRAEVRAARARNPDATPEELSELLVLPVSLIARHLGLPVPPAKPRRGAPRPDDLREKLYRRLRRKKVTT
jgi:hypothetical protein